MAAQSSSVNSPKDVGAGMTTSLPSPSSSSNSSVVVGGGGGVGGGVVNAGPVQRQMSHVQLQVCGQPPQMNVVPLQSPQQQHQTVTTNIQNTKNSFISTTTTPQATIANSNPSHMQLPADSHPIMIVSNSNGNNTVQNQQQLMSGQQQQPIPQQQQQQGGQGFMLDMHQQQQQNLNEMMVGGGSSGGVGGPQQQQQQQQPGMHMQQFHPSQQKPVEVHGQVKNASDGQQQQRLSPLTLHAHNDNALLPSSNTGHSASPRGEPQSSPPRTNNHHHTNNHSNLNNTTSTSLDTTSNSLRSSVKITTLPKTQNVTVAATDNPQQRSAAADHFLLDRDECAGSVSSPRTSSNSSSSPSSDTAVGSFTCFSNKSRKVAVVERETTNAQEDQPPIEKQQPAKKGFNLQQVVTEAAAANVNIVVSQPIGQFMKTITMGQAPRAAGGLILPSPHLTIQPQSHPSSSQFVIHQPGPHYHPLLHSGPAPNVTVNPNGNFQTNPNATIRATYTPFRAFSSPFQAINNFGRFAGPIQATQLPQGVQSPILAAQLQTINQIATAQMQGQAPLLHIQSGGAAGGKLEQIRKNVMPIFVSTTLHQPPVQRVGTLKEAIMGTAGSATVTTVKGNNSTVAEGHISPMSSCTVSPTSACSSPALNNKNLGSTESSTPSPQSSTSSTVNSLTPQPDQNIRVLTPSEIMRTLPSIPSQDADRSHDFGDQVDAPRSQGFNYHNHSHQPQAETVAAMVRKRVGLTIRFYSLPISCSI